MTVVYKSLDIVTYLAASERLQGVSQIGRDLGINKADFHKQELDYTTAYTMIDIA